MSHPAKIFLLAAVPVLGILLAVLGIITIPNNFLGWFLFFIGVTFTGGSLIIPYLRREDLWGLNKRDEIVLEETRDRSFWLISLAMMVAIYLPPLEYLYIPLIIPRARWIQIFGLSVVILGCILFIWARHTLGRHYSGHVSILADQELVLRGPYTLIGHPAYAAYILITIGIAVGYSSMLGIVSSLFLVIPAMVYRIHIEDRLLAARFGEKFEEYTRRVKRLIPGLW